MVRASSYTLLLRFFTGFLVLSTSALSTSGLLIKLFPQPPFQVCVGGVIPI